MTRIITEKVRFSYANVWEAKSINGSEPKYSVSLVIDKSDKKTIELVKAAIKEAEENGIDKFGKGFTSGSGFKRPLRDGDIDRPDDETYKNCYFVNANSKDRPNIVDRNVKAIIDKNEFYSGCYGRASITFYPFNTSGNKGIACYLGNLQKLGDGEPLGSVRKAEDDFETVADEDFYHDKKENGLMYLDMKVAIKSVIMDGLEV